MKRPKIIITLLLLPSLAFGAATVTFNLTDFLGTVETLKKKQVRIEPLSTVRGSGTTVVTSERRFVQTSTLGVFTLTNVNEGLYRVIVSGNNYTSVFHVNIPDTNGTLTASEHLAVLASGALQTDEGTILLLDE
jgi:hypothetical protein